MEAEALDVIDFQAKWEPLSTILQRPENEKEYDRLVAYMETLLEEKDDDNAEQT